LDLGSLRRRQRHGVRALAQRTSGKSLPATDPAAVLGAAAFGQPLSLNQP